ncbi:hypothetical protein OG588_28765 [Streptomyces prunicolor]|uniref:hypothetical protein n=1 Tax=Streptomyces prunicolor TaxID=67348 RepID=UPI00386FF825|nr:hypothetical protein OG588_28765 [Streptomyces prunicolor]
MTFTQAGAESAVAATYGSGNELPLPHSEFVAAAPTVSGPRLRRHWSTSRAS